MKVPALERKIYNYIQQQMTVPANRIPYFFGNGDYALDSYFIHNAVALFDMNLDVAKSMKHLIEQGNIFEVAVPPEFFLVLNGHLPEISKYFSVSKFKDPHYKYGYQGKTWLPVVYCSDAGIRDLVKLYFKHADKTPAKDTTLFLTMLDIHIKGDSAERIKAAIAASLLLAGPGYDRPFQKLLKESYEGINEVGRENLKKRNPKRGNIYPKET